MYILKDITDHIIKKYLNYFGHIYYHNQIFDTGSLATFNKNYVIFHEKGDIIAIHNIITGTITRERDSDSNVQLVDTTIYQKDGIKLVSHNIETNEKRYFDIELENPVYFVNKDKFYILERGDEYTHDRTLSIYNMDMVLIDKKNIVIPTYIRIAVFWVVDEKMIVSDKYYYYGFSLNTGHLLFGYEDNMRTAIHRNKLYSIENKKTIIIYDVVTLEKLHTIAMDHDVDYIEIENNVLYTGPNKGMTYLFLLS
jgi:hypothetical protein